MFTALGSRSWRATRSVSCLIAASLICVSSAARLRASDNKTRAGTIFVYWQGNRWANNTFGHSAETQLNLIPTGGISLSSHPNEQIEVIVADRNPFLYSYKWNGVTQAPTSDYSALAAFATALQGVVTAVAPLANSGGAPLKANLESLIGKTSMRNFVAPTAAAAAAPVAGNAVDALLIKAGFDTPFVGDFATHFIALQTKTADGFKGLIDDCRAYTSALSDVAVGPGQKGLANDPQKTAWITIDVPAIKSWDDVSYFAKGSTTLAGARAALIAGLSDPAQSPALTSALSTSVLYQELNLLAGEQGHIDTMTAAVTTFTTSANLVGHPLSLGTIGPISNANTSTATMAFTQPDGTVGNLTITATPSNPIAVGVGPGYVYSYVRDPAKTGPYTGSRTAFMISLSPARSADNLLFFEGVFGVSPASNSNAFLFGIGIHAPNIFEFVGGLIVQQVKTDTTVGFQRAPFLGVTIDLKVK